LCRKAKLANGHCWSGNACLRGPGKVVIGAAPREMHYGIDLTGLKRIYQCRRKRRTNGTIDNTHLGGDPVRRQVSEEIGGAIRAGEIQQRGIGVSMLGDESPHQIAHVATRGHDIPEPGLARGLRAAMTDGEQRQLRQSFARGIACNRICRIRASNDDCAPRASKISGKWFYPQERRHQNVVPVSTEHGGSSLAIGPWTGNDDSHGSIEKSRPGPVL
jgi:hypothetical protein